MAKVHLYSVALERPAINRYGEGAYRAMLASARADRFGVHSLTDDPAAADLILFLEINESGPRAVHVRRHPLVRQYRQKCFLSDPYDEPIAFLPGIYASVSRRWHSPWRTRSGPYPSSVENPCVRYDPDFAACDYLYSFMGDQTTSPLRGQLATLRHPRGFFEDRSADSLRIRMTGTDEERASFTEHYADVLRRSLFVLCPRGVGVSSIRLFETLRAGRVPVILSDGWVPPEGPDWERCSLRVPERDWAAVPGLLTARETAVPAMGRLARQAWEEWFSPPVLFHRTVEQCLAIQSARRLPERLAGLLVWPQVVLRPVHLRLLVKDLLGRG